MWRAGLSIVTLVLSVLVIGQWPVGGQYIPAPWVSQQGVARGPITIAQGTITASAPIVNLSSTFNNGAVTFAGIKYVITDTASASGSLPFQILGGAGGAANLMSLDKSGTLVLGRGTTISVGYGFLTSTRGGMYMLGDGVLSVYNNSGTGSGGVNIGPTTGNTERGSSSITNGLVTINMATATGSGSGTITSPTTAIPANSQVWGMTCKVTTILAGASLTTFSLGDGTDADRWGTGIAIAAGTTINLANWTLAAPWPYATATSLVLTAAAGVFSTGVLSCSPHILSFTPIGS